MAFHVVLNTSEIYDFAYSENKNINSAQHWNIQQVINFSTTVDDAVGQCVVSVPPMSQFYRSTVLRVRWEFVKFATRIFLRKSKHELSTLLIFIFCLSLFYNYVELSVVAENTMILIFLSSSYTLTLHQASNLNKSRSITWLIKLIK